MESSTCSRCQETILAPYFTPMALRFPDCAECGASIRSHDDDACPFCDTVIPLELWDEISENRIQLIEADALSFEAAVYRVERSDAFAGEKLRARRRRRRLRPKRPKPDAQGNVRTPATAETLLAFVGGGILTVIGVILLRGHGLALLIPFAYAGLLATVQWRQRSREDRRFANKRARYFQGGHSYPLAVGVLEVTPPQTHGSGDDARRARTVVLYTAKGDQHVLLASPESELSPGDVGIATVRGIDLVTFAVQDQVR